MARQGKEKKTLEGLAKFNRVKPVTNIIYSLVFIILALMCLIPLIFVIIISFTDTQSIAIQGYSFFPSGWSVQAYESMFANSYSLLRALGNTLFVVVVGTVLGLVLNATMGYVLSRSNFKLKKLYTWIVFIPMVFNGGMVSSFMVNTNVLHLKDTIWALILPLAVSSFYIIILRTFFTTTVPDSLIESGKIDGASQLRIFFQIVVPISLPALATVGLFLAFTYWNDWFQALLYVTNETALWPLQYMLMSIEKNLQFLAQNPAMAGMAAAELLAKLPQDGVRMALVVLTVVPIACTYPFFQRYFISGLTIGAVKG